jgi:hypothetical protein
VVAELLELVDLRNRWARELGFANYYELQLHVGEQKPEEVLKIFDELDALTQGPFFASEDAISARALAKKFTIPASGVNALALCGSQVFFQEAPSVSGVRFDDVYEKQDILKLARDFCTRELAYRLMT